MHEIPRDRIDEYIRVLSEQVQAISRRQFGVDRDKGRDLLSKTSRRQVADLPPTILAGADSKLTGNAFDPPKW